MCIREARKAKIKGKFASLVASTKYAFREKYPVKGKIYQVVDGKSIDVAENFESLVAGKNEAIYATAAGKKVDSKIEFAWTGQKDLMQPSSTDLNCSDWTNNKNEAIVGLISRSGSEAFAERYIKCSEQAHLYCIQYK